MRIDWRRLRPAELLALIAGVLLAVALFMPWYGFQGARRDAWSSLTVTEIPAALAALGALCLVGATLVQRSPAIPLAIAVSTAVVGLVALVVVAVRAVSLPGGATERCFGLWLGATGAVGVLTASMLSLRDERPGLGGPASR